MCEYECECEGAYTCVTAVTDPTQRVTAIAALGHRFVKRACGQHIHPHLNPHPNSNNQNLNPQT